MDEMPSAEFRVKYAKLTEPTVVTVNGHPIGSWIPARMDMTFKSPPHPIVEKPLEAAPPVRFSTRPFTPAPKPTKR